MGALTASIAAAALLCASSCDKKHASVASQATLAAARNTGTEPGGPRVDRGSPAAAATTVETSARWRAYWHAGLAELTRYSLQQARYGELRGGEAVVVFVTEDFLPGKQVKSERPRAPGEVVPVLKMNLTKSFPTGIYTYSAMTSVFSPIALGRAAPPALKVTTSVQEWCGHAWTQLNQTPEGYRARTFSYFEDEGDAETTLPPALLEDHIWTRLRMGPRELPVGELRVVPATLTSRFRHRRLAAERATAALTTLPRSGGSKVMLRYTLEYGESQRAISWDVAADFPHEIAAWTESYPEGNKGERLTTAARSTHVLRDAYWKHNKNADRDLRDKLGLVR